MHPIIHAHPIPVAVFTDEPKYDHSSPEEELCWTASESA